MNFDLNPDECVHNAVKTVLHRLLLCHVGMDTERDQANVVFVSEYGSSFKTEGFALFGTGLMMDFFHMDGMVQISTDQFNSLLKTTLS